MKRIIFIIGISCLTLTNLSAQTIVTSPISTNTTWSLSGSPYIITSNLQIDVGVTLSIEAGVEIKIENSSINSYGKIIAHGSPTNSIIFTSNKAIKNPLDWDRILLQGTGADDSEFSYCIIEYGYIGLALDQCAGLVVNSKIRYCHRSGIAAAVGSPRIMNCTIHDITNEGIHIASGSPLVENNMIFNNIDGIVTDYGNSYIANNIIYRNSRYGVDNRNTDDSGALTTIINNTLDENGLIEAGPYGSNINCDNASPIVKNNIITNSTSIVAAGIRATSGGIPIISFNNVYNNAGGNYIGCSAGAGDLSLDPQFIDRSIADYHLSDTSPCLKAAYALDAPTRDYDSNVRGNPPDMGALENISDGDQTLPVQLTSFTAEYSNEEIIIRWVTQTEVNNLGYEIHYRMSSDTNFRLLASYKSDTSLMGKGTSPQPSHYSFVDNRIQPNQTYYYKLFQVDFGGQTQEYGPIKIETLDSEKTKSPDEYVLYQNYPNPFNSSTIISFYLPQREHIKLSVYNLLGGDTEILLDGIHEAGYYSIPFRRANNPSGIYIYKLESEFFMKSNSMFFIK